MNDFFPRLVRIDATWRCNLNCKHCQTGMFRNDDHPEDMNLDEFKSLFMQLSALGTNVVGFLGGEPMMRRDMPELLQTLKQLGIKSGITTNGILITEKSSHFLMNDIQTSITVSLDGPDESSHEFIRGERTYKKAINGLEKLLTNRHKESISKVGISAVLNKNNIAKAADFLKLAKDLKVDHLILASVHPVGNARDNWDDLSVDLKDLLIVAEDLMKKVLADPDLPSIQMNFLTPAVIEYLRKIKNLPVPQQIQLDNASLYECYIQCDGRVFPSQKCSEMVPEVLNGVKELGLNFRDNSVKTKSFQDIWFGPDFEGYRNIMLKKQHIKNYNSCSNCSFSKTYCLPSAGAYLAGEKDPQPICIEAHKQLGSLATYA